MPREVYLEGYLKAISDNDSDNSHISNLTSLNGSEINTNTFKNNSLYTNSKFGYYLGDSTAMKSVEFELSLSSLNSQQNISLSTLKVAINDYGWKDPKYNDLNINGIMDYWEEGPLYSETADRAGNEMYITHTSNSNTIKYDGWDSKNIARNYCVLRRGYTYPLAIVCNNNFYVQLDYLGSFQGDDGITLTWNGGNSWNIALSDNGPILIVEIEINLNNNIFGIGGIDPGCGIAGAPPDMRKITIMMITVYIIFNLPSCSGNSVKDGLPINARCHYLYDDGSSSGTIKNNWYRCGGYYYSTNWGSQSTSNYYYYGTTDDAGTHMYGKGENGGLNPQTKVVYELACAAAHGCTNVDDAAGQIAHFILYLIKGRWGVGINSDQYWTAVNTNLNNIDISLAFDPSKIDTNNDNDASKSNDALGLNQQKIYQCMDFAGISTPLDRALGIAARQVTGFDFLDGTTKYWIFHVWTEVWRPDTSAWHVYDSCGANYESPQYFDNDDTWYYGTRNDYYDDYRYGSPTKVWLFYETSSGRTAEDLTDCYKSG